MTTAPTFERVDCITRVDGVHRTQYRTEPREGVAWDARGADFVTDRIRHGAILLDGDEPGMCWAGGHVRSTRPLTASWADHKANWPEDNPSRNSAAIDVSAPRACVTGLHAENVGDGVRVRGPDCTVQHSLFEYVRDDAIEADDLHALLIDDCLIDGAYVGISARPAKGYSGSKDYGGGVITLQNTLIRMEPQPYPYVWRKKGGNINARGEPWQEGDGVPYGHGPIFKIENHDIPGRNVRWRFRNVTVCVTHRIGNSRLLDFPPASLVDECENLTIIWLGEGDYPGMLMGVPGAQVVTGLDGRVNWGLKTHNWRQRHPGVGNGWSSRGIEWPRGNVPVWPRPPALRY